MEKSGKKGREFLVEVEGKPFHVQVQPLSRSEFLVTVDGKAHRVRAADSSFKVAWGPEFLSVHVRRQNPTAFSVSLANATLEARVMPKHQKAEPTPGDYVMRPEPKPPSPTQQGAVLSPMPGKVTALKVKAGQTVKAGDTLLILEAMKMENEVVAERGGIVKEVKVEVGSLVGVGDVLLVLG